MGAAGSRTPNVTEQSPPLPQPSETPHLWRDLDEYGLDAPLESCVGDEFGPDAVDPPGEMSRRQVMKAFAASAALLGLAACDTRPARSIVPYVRPEERIVPGRPLFFATALTHGPEVQGVLVESHTGRPTKVEGNPDHPASLGATDVFSQAAVLSLCDPDRSQTVYHDGQISTADRLDRALDHQVARIREHGGRGFALLTGEVTSPLLQHQIETLLSRLPEARWYVHEAIDRSRGRAAAEAAFGKPADLVYRFDAADVILSLECDFLFELPGRTRYARDFSSRRRVRTGEDEAGRRMNRLYVVEATPTITGASADHRLALRSSQVETFVRQLAARLGVDVGAAGAATRPAGGDSPVSEKWLSVIAADLEAARGTSLVVAGASQAAAVHLLAHAINAHLGNFGRTVMGIERPAARTHPFAEMAGRLRTGEIETLVILNANPAYDAPADYAFGDLLVRVPFSAHFGLYRDETALLCRWHMPLAHDLESWSDARAFDGTVSLVQPLIEPLFGARSAHAVMARLANEPPRADRERLQAFWSERAGQHPPSWWESTLRRGAVDAPSAPSLDAGEVAARVRSELRRLAESPATSPAQPSGSLEIVFRPDYSLWDGRHANNAWLAELPRPTTKLTWDNAALISPRTAARLGVETEQVVTLGYRDRALGVPVYVMPGQADDCIAVTLGYGRWAAGTIGNGVGFNAYALRRSDALWFDGGARIERTGGIHPLATTQKHHSMAGRDLVHRAAARDFPVRFEQQRNKRHLSLSLFPAQPQSGRQWGMVIDLSACTGCNVCTIACQAENNIPAVGRQEVLRGREMHWIRVDRYFSGPPEDPATYFMPVPCMHCETAPCELVCPVEATSHSTDGLNEMTYNRCVGTRYCANNCPYKVRRFNFLQYSDETTESLELLRNPDVTVRTRGVMEKCTYCVQRIRQADANARKETRPIYDGEVLTACQQACPAGAIVFGDINDAGARITAWRKQPHNYGLLAELNTRPRTTYLAAIRNPNRELSPESSD